MLSTTAITADPVCQPRIAIDPRIVEDYSDDMTGGADFPPLTVYHDGETYWLADGFHRLAAAKQLGLSEIACDIRMGDKRAAVLHSVGANATHGARRTNQDKRRSVETLLNDDEWRGWSDREIARKCGVSHEWVGQVRGSLSTVDSERTYTDRWGNTHTMNTANIGKTAASPKQSAPTWTPPSTIPGDLVDMVFPDAEDYVPVELPPVVKWDDRDAEAFIDFAAAVARDPQRVAYAAFASRPFDAKLMASRIPYVREWIESFAAAMRACSQ